VAHRPRVQCRATRGARKQYFDSNSLPFPSRPVSIIRLSSHYHFSLQIHFRRQRKQTVCTTNVQFCSPWRSEYVLTIVHSYASVTCPWKKVTKMKTKCSSHASHLYFHSSICHHVCLTCMKLRIGIKVMGTGMSL